MLSLTLYTDAEIRSLEQLAEEQFNLNPLTLMQAAGRAAFNQMRRRWPIEAAIEVVCGPGNNGGDGYVLAELAHRSQLPVTVYTLGDHTALTGPAQASAAVCQAAGVTIKPFTATTVLTGELVIDAIFGTGLARSVTGLYAEAIDKINRSGRRILALDIPSGLHADSGQVLGLAVRAETTSSFIGLKRGMVTGQGPDCCGDLYLDELGLPSEAFEQVPGGCQRLVLPELLRQLPPRRAVSHKGQFGHVLVIGGDHGMAGAVRMAAEAAARVGAGLVSVATRSEHLAVVNSGRPELMCYGVDKAKELAPLLARATAVILGPGLGQTAWGKQLFSCALETTVPMVVDADGLNLLVDAPSQRTDWLLTPHPGEAARLLGQTTDAVNADRFQTLNALQAKYGGACLLKGAGSLVIRPEGRLAVCTDGNPGMASGGMGDVLSGVLGGLLAQGLAPGFALELGVCLHACAGDAAVQESGERGLLASDLLPFLRALLNDSSSR